MRTLFTFVLGGIVGLVGGAAAMLVAFPFIFPPPVVSEPPPVMAAPAAPVAPGGATPSLATAPLQKAGAFQFDEKAPGRDRLHWANGSGSIYKGPATIIRFEEDFKAGPGPHYWVYLNTKPVGEATAFKADAGRLKLAPLKSFTGSQNFTLPASVDLAKYHTVTIWCETFSVYIGSAVLPKS